MKEIGSRIKAARKSKNLKQNDLALKISIDNSQFSKIENGKLLPTIQQLIELSSILEVTTDWILLGRDKIQGSSDLNAYELKLKDIKIRAAETEKDLLADSNILLKEINKELKIRIANLERTIDGLKKELKSKDCYGSIAAEPVEKLKKGK